MICPCRRLANATVDYADCCEPLHLGKVVANSAEQLMRSRYSAYALQQIDYLINTAAVGQQGQLDHAAIAAWSAQNEWQGLDIVAVTPKLGKQHAMVHFKAHFFDGTAQQVHEEQSYFVCLKGQWYFLDPTLDSYPSLKQPCICGSGVKFKACCAKWLG